MKQIAIIGYGVVGGGITTVLEQNRDAIARAVGDRVRVKSILDLRDFPDSPFADRVTHSFDDLLNDPEVALVCETMGGAHPAFEYSMALLKKGKHVVTSNKEVVASFGADLLAQAAASGVSYLFEASVGGGIPVIRSFATSLAGERIVKIDAVLNGTTNYILTQMRRRNISFEEALTEAQALGYAEKNPASDVDGIDSKRKIMILAALASGVLLSDGEVYAQTMTKLTPADHAAAERWGGSVKLLASARFDDEGRCALYVCPMFVPWRCPLAALSDVYNAISVTTAVTGDMMYYGRGAGRLPTAGAVVSDVCAALSGAAAAERTPVFRPSEKKDVIPFETIPFFYYVRMRTEENNGLAENNGLELLRGAFDEVTPLAPSAGEDCVEAIVGPAPLPGMEAFRRRSPGVESIIRVMNF